MASSLQFTVNSSCPSVTFLTWLQFHVVNVPPINQCPKEVRIESNTLSLLWFFLLFFLTIVIAITGAYKLGKKRGEAVKKSKEVDDKQQPRVSMGVEDYTNYFGSSESKSKNSTQDTASQESINMNQKVDCKDESSSTDSSPGIEGCVKSGTVLFNNNNSNSEIFKLDKSDMSVADKMDPSLSALNEELRNSPAGLYRFGSNISTPSMPRAQASASDVIFDRKISSPDIPCCDIVQYSSDKTGNQVCIIPEPYGVLNASKDPKSLELYLQYECDNNGSQTNDSNTSTIPRAPSDKLIDEKIKLGDDNDTENMKVHFQTVIRERDGKIEKAERTEVITILKNTPQVQNNIQLVRNAAESPTVTIWRHLIDRKATEESLPKKSDESNASSTKMKSKSKSSDNVGAMAVVLVPANKENKHENAIDLAASATSIDYNVQMSQLMQAVREKLDIPDETGKFNKIFANPVVIGKGSFGKVFRVRHKLEDKIYAVKKIKLRLDDSNNVKNHKVFREVRAMTNLHHPCIVRYSTSWVELETDIEEVKKHYQKRQNSGSSMMKSQNKLRAIENRSQIIDSILTAGDEDDSPAKSKTSELGFEWDVASNNHNQTDNASKVSASTVSKEVSNPRTEKYNRQRKANYGSQLLHTIDDEEKDDDENSSITSSSHTNLSKSNSISLKQFVKTFLYIQMEFCSGQTLKNFLDTSKKTCSRVSILKMYKKLLEGMIAIHNEGIIHRDLKPENIFLDESNNVKIGDFGLASLENKEDRDSVAAQIALPSIEKLSSGESEGSGMKRMHSFNIGTPMYTSPEQEKAGDYDEKTDVYSLGLILFEMFADFSTNHERYLLFKALRDKHVVPEVLRKKQPKESELILKMTTVDPKARPDTRTIMAEIDHLLHGLEKSL
jgi:serine/threonine protein kinase